MLQSQFDIRIKNIGLGSLVDFEVVEAYYTNEKEEEKNLDVCFDGNFILGKEETIRLVVKLRMDLEVTDTTTVQNLEQLKILATFNDLLGHSYAQEFTIASETHSLGRREIKREDGRVTKARFTPLNRPGFPISIPMKSNLCIYSF